MNRKTGLLLSALVLFTSIAGVSAYAHEGWWGMGKKHEFAGKRGGFAGREYGLEKVFFHKAFFLLKVQDKLGLTETQVQAIRSLKLETAKSMIHQKADLKALALDIRAQLHSDKVDAASISTLIDQKYEIKKAMEKTAVEAYVKLQGILTATQQAEVKKLRKEWKEKRSECRKCSKHHFWFSKAGDKSAGETGEAN